MDRTRKSIGQYANVSAPYVARVDRLAVLYEGVPTMVARTGSIDPKGALGKSLAVTSLENYAVLGTWKQFLVDQQAAGKAALTRLADAGNTGYLAQFNRVPEALEKAFVGR